MNFKKTINIIFLLTLFFPPFYANAENKDYLAIDLRFNFANKQFSILKVEQKIFESSDILEYGNSTFSVNLVRGSKVISSTSFPAPQQQNYSAFGEDGIHTDVGFLDTEIINIMLAITEPLEFADRLEIKDGTKKIFSQNLNTTPIEVLSGTQPLIPEPETEAQSQEPRAKKLIISLAVGLLVIIIIGLLWYKNRNNTKLLR